LTKKKKKIGRPHFNGKKAECGGIYLSSQLQQEAKLGESRSRPVWAKSKTLF
jgi:hypothetical protein